MLECLVCQRNKGEIIKTPGLLQPLSIPSQCWEEVSMDFITGLPKSKGHNFIMVAVDHLTKYAHFIALSHPFTTSIVAKVFLENIQKRYMVHLRLLLVIMILSLLVTFGKIYSHVWVLNWLIVLHTILNQMGKMRLLINFWKDIYIVSL